MQWPPTAAGLEHDPGVMVGQVDQLTNVDVEVSTAMRAHWRRRCSSRAVLGELHKLSCAGMVASNRLTKLA